MREGNEQKSDGLRMVKLVLEISVLVCLATSLVVYLFAEQLGFDEDTAFYVAIAFLVAGVGDFIMLRLWDRLTARS